MSVEIDLTSVLGAIADRVYPDTAPEMPAVPFVMYQQVGGAALNFLRGVPDKRNGTFQINVWAKTRIEASTMIREIEDAIRLDERLLASTLGGALSTYDELTGWYGSQQDFSIWFIN